MNGTFRIASALPVLLAATLFFNAEDKARAAAEMSPAPGRQVSPDERAKIVFAIPTHAPAQPKQPRRLMIFDRNVNYGGHLSIPHANLAFQLMGLHTGAFTAIVETEPDAFEAQNLAHYDAVCFNNTVGNLFTDPQLRQNLADFVERGGGLMGLHGATTAFTDWPGATEDWPHFGLMLGARGATHRESNEEVHIRIEDPDHPVVAAFHGQPFTYRDEFFRYTEPYSRERVRVLLSFDTGKTDMNQGRAFGKVFREDNDYPIAWVRQHGKGRVFYSTIAHNPYVFWDPTMLEFYLAATQFVLGDLDGEVAPSAPTK